MVKTSNPLASRPSLSPGDAAELEFLISIRAWTLSFLEEIGSSNTQGEVVLPKPSSLTYNAENLSCAFQLTASLLQQGEGRLAGLLARKAFVQAEAILDVEGPLFIWNFLEIMWHMLKNKQTQLPLMLFAYLSNLASQTRPKQDPMLRTLRSLESLVWHHGLNQDSDWKLGILQHGWAVNADMLFTPPDSRLLLLYYRIVWDSELVKLPEAGLRAADKLYASIEDKVPAGPAIAMEMDQLSQGLDGFLSGHRATDSIESADFSQLPARYNSLMVQSLEKIKYLAATEPVGTLQRFRALAARVKTRLWEGSVTEMEASKRNPAVQRLNARTLSYVMRVIMDTEADNNSDVDTQISYLRDIIAVLEYGQSPIAPQVVRELQYLEKLLLQGGYFDEAEEVRQDYIRRVQRYVGDLTTLGLG